MGNIVGFVPDQVFGVAVVRHSVTEACPEARAVLVGDGTYQVMGYRDRSYGPLKYFIFNPEIDNLEITTNLPWFGRQPHLILGDTILPQAHFAALPAIKHLPLQLPHLAHQFGGPIRGMMG